jgi:O-antigen/teichoic acid export membrane protein
MSISTSLFPALAEKENIGTVGDIGIGILYFRAMNFMLLIMLPITIALSVFSHEILYYWLGGNFPLFSNLVFRLLAIAAFVQALGYIPLTTLQAAGKPEIAAKLYIVEIPLYIFLCFILIPVWGIDGAAWAFLIRLLIIVSALLWVTQKKMLNQQLISNKRKVWRSIILNGVLLITLLLITIIIGNIVQKGVLLIIILIAYFFIGWFYCIEEIERRTLIRLFIKEGKR